MPLHLEPGVVEDARAGGDPLERLIVAVWPQAYRIALGILRDTGLAEDAAQDACASIARSVAGLGDAAAFAAWSYRIVVNAAMTAARRRPPVRALEIMTDRGVHVDPSDAIDIDAALAKLPAIQRAVVISHYYGGLTSGEIASAIGAPAGTVRFHLMLARRALRKALLVTDARASLVPKETHVHGR